MRMKKDPLCITFYKFFTRTKSKSPTAMKSFQDTRSLSIRLKEVLEGNITCERVNDPTNLEKRENIQSRLLQIPKHLRSCQKTNGINEYVLLFFIFRDVGRFFLSMNEHLYRAVPTQNNH